MTDNELIEAMARAYVHRAAQQGFHVDDAACEDRMSAALAAIREAGFAVVPVEPTEGMQNAGNQYVYDFSGDTDTRDIYRAMIAAYGGEGK